MAMLNIVASLVVAATLSGCVSVSGNLVRQGGDLSSAAIADGLVSVKSPHTTKDTMNRLEALVKQKGLDVLARVDHAAGARKIGAPLRPTELLIFGSPQGGAPLMQCAQSSGIDLPLKALVWEDASSQVWLSYNDPSFIAQRHRISQCAAVQNLRNTLADLAQGAVTP